jgi:cytoskeletal protein RodZ
MGSIGSDLRQAREAAGISREELSARTKIRPSILEAMEQDDFRQLPAGLLGRGHLRAYAREVRLNPDRVVQRFTAEWMTEPAPPKDAPVETGHRRVPVGTVAVIVATAALALFARTLGRESAPGELDAVGTAGSTVTGTAAPVADAASSPVEKAAAPPAATAARPLSLELTPTDTVWVEARADGQRVLYALVAKGESPVVQANEEIRLRLGDAGALGYSINGKRGRPFGRPGEVRDIRITPENAPTFQE